MQVKERHRSLKIEDEKRSFSFDGSVCAHCALEIEDLVSKIRGVDEVYYQAEIKELNVYVNGDSNKETLLRDVQKIVDRVEPGVKISAKEEFDVDKEDMNNEDLNPRVVFSLAKNQVVLLARILISLMLLMPVIFVPMDQSLRLGLALVAYFLGGYDVFLSGVKSLSRFNISNEKVLMTVATIGAFILGEYSEAVAVMLFYQVGEFIQDLAVDRSRDSITKLVQSLKTDVANLIDPLTNEIHTVKPKDVAKGSLIQIRAGEKVPLDGMVVQGTSYMDTKALTGEPMPRAVGEGDLISSGFLNTKGLLTVKTTAAFEDSTVEQILKMTSEAARHKAPTERYIARFARVYTPLVMALALLLAVIPPLVIPGSSFQDWVYRALIFLVVSCPCALVVSVPLGFFGGIGSASKQGILVKGAEYLESLAHMHTVVFDKTGTLTKGEFKLSKIDVYEDLVTEEKLLELAAVAEMQSNHPIAKSILDAAKDFKKDTWQILSQEEHAGLGTIVRLEDMTVVAGNATWLKENQVDVPKAFDEGDGTQVLVAKDGHYLGRILVEDQVKDGIKDAIAGLRERGMQQSVMLTGDSKAVAKKISQLLTIDSYQAECMPKDKVQVLESLIQKTHQNGKQDKLIFVGDGINDAPALARADVGVAMGMIGQAAAIEAADVVLVDDKLDKLVTAHEIASFTKRVVAQNIALALGIKVLVLILSALGLAGMWGAVFADVGVTILAVLNSVRVLLRKPT